MMLTKRIIEAGKSSRNGWSIEQLRCILPSSDFRPGNQLRKGWKDRMLGQDVTQGQIDKFLSLKNAHLKAKQPHIEREVTGCPIFPAIDSSNRKEWQNKVRRMNPWLPEDIFESESA